MPYKLYHHKHACLYTLLVECSNVLLYCKHCFNFYCTLEYVCYRCRSNAYCELMLFCYILSEWVDWKVGHALEDDGNVGASLARWPESEGKTFQAILTSKKGHLAYKHTIICLCIVIVWSKSWVTISKHLAKGNWRYRARKTQICHFFKECA